MTQKRTQSCSFKTAHAHCGYRMNSEGEDRTEAVALTAELRGRTVTSPGTAVTGTTGFFRALQSNCWELSHIKYSLAR